MKKYNSERFAIYYAPKYLSELDSLGCSWVGRDTVSGAQLRQPIVPGMTAKRLKALTDSARHYGFHATLKAPFHLKNGATRAALESTVEKICASLHPVTIRLTLKSLDGFFALMSSSDNAEILQLANTLVGELDVFRSPSTSAEIERRRAKKLSSIQDDNLLQWGYPFVFSEFRFHMTLTSKITSVVEREALRQALQVHFFNTLEKDIVLDEICLFHQGNTCSQFQLVRQFKLG